MKFKLNAKMTKAIFNTLQNVATEGIIEFRKNEIYTVVMNEGRTALAEFIINKEDIKFQQKSIVPIKIGVEFENLWKIIKELKDEKKDEILFNIDIENSILWIIQGDIKIRYKLYSNEKLDKIDSINPDTLLDMDYPLEMVVNFPIFKRITNLGKVFSDNIRIKMSSTIGISFYSEGEKGNIRHYRQTDLSNSISKEDIQSQGLFNINQITSIMKMSKVTDKFLIRVKDSTPIFLEVNFGNESSCKCFIGGQIEEEEEDITDMEYHDETPDVTYDTPKEDLPKESKPENPKKKSSKKSKKKSKKKLSKKSKKKVSSEMDGPMMNKNIAGDNEEPSIEITDDEDYMEEE